MCVCVGRKTSYLSGTGPRDWGVGAVWDMELSNCMWDEGGVPARIQYILVFNQYFRTMSSIVPTDY